MASDYTDRDLLDKSEERSELFELYGALAEGLTDIAEGRMRPFSEAMADLKTQRHKR